MAPFLAYGETAAAAYRERVMGRLAPALGPGRGRRALDLGCGEGHEALWLAKRGFKVRAMDLRAQPSWKAMARAAKGRLSFKTGDASSLGGPSGAYDVVMEKDMAHHAADPAAAFAEMARLCKPGGLVAVVEANRLNPVFYVHLTLLGEHDHFTFWKLRSLLGAAGMGSAQIQRLEARVWPFEHEGAQRLMARLQDLAEALPPLRPFLCYHLALWRKPGRAGGR